MRKIIPFSIFLLSVSFTFGQQLNPVKWTQTVQKVSENEYDIVFTANVEDGWYVYSQFLEGDNGPIPTSFNFNSNDQIEFIGKTKETGKKKAGYDEMFMMDVVKFGGKVTFTQRVKTSASSTNVSGYLEYMTCDNERCLPPAAVDFSLDLQ